MKKNKIGLFFLMIIISICAFTITTRAAYTTADGNLETEGVVIKLDTYIKCISGDYYYNPRSGVSDCKKLYLEWGKIKSSDVVVNTSYSYYKAKHNASGKPTPVSITSNYSSGVKEETNIGPGNVMLSINFSKQTGHAQTTTYTASVKVKLKPDSTPPTCSLANSSKWYKNGDTVTINCKDTSDVETSKGSGCVTSSVTKTISNGSVPSFNFKDNMGNEGGCNVAASLKVDNTKPTCSVSVSDVGKWTKEKTITWTCKDTGGAGCTAASSESLLLKENSGPWTQTECKDKAGNVGTKRSASVSMIDRKSPTCNNPILPDDYIRTPFDVTATCTDNGTDAERSGCEKTNYVTTIADDKTKTVTVKDNVGWTATCSITYNKFDSNGPEVIITLEDAFKDNATDKQAHTDKILVNIKATDDKSGVNRLCYVLSGATTQAETCVNASETNLSISNHGDTLITAYAFDNAKDTDAENDTFVYNGGNRSTDATQNVYIDNKKPVIKSVTQPTANWQSAAYPVTIVAEDADSGMATIETYWSLSNDITKTFGAANKDRTEGETLPVTNTGGTKVYLTPNATTEKSQTATSTSEATLALSGKMYLHVRACDKAVGPNNSLKPNCTTGVYGPYLYDGNAAADISVNAGSIDWTNKFSLTVTAKDESYSGKEGSGIDKIQVFFNADAPFMNTNKDSAVYNGTPTIANNSCNDTETCTFTFDFAGLKSNPTVNGEPVKVVDGIRFIKVVVVDGVGNTSEPKYFGPYKWDTTPPKSTNNPTFNGLSNGTYMPYNY